MPSSFQGDWGNIFTISSDVMLRQVKAYKNVAIINKLRVTREDIVEFIEIIKAIILGIVQGITEWLPHIALVI